MQPHVYLCGIYFGGIPETHLPLLNLSSEVVTLHKVLVGKPDCKRPLGRPRRRWEDNIKIDLQEVGRGCGDWIGLAQDRGRWRALVSAVMNFRVL